MLMTQPRAPTARIASGAPGEADPCWSDTFVLRLRATPAACPVARRHLAWLLAEWGLARLTDTAELMAAELLANAVTAARDEELAPDGQPLVVFRVSRAAAGLVLEVWDPSPEPPVARQAGAMDESGRGLQLVQALTTAWGFYRPPTGGKVVWCQLALDDEPPAAWSLLG